MSLPQLIADLSRPDAYPFDVAAVEVHQTHISVVFLAGLYAYKIKKPVTLGFLDFSTLDRRRHFCEEEVRLNRRLAPDVYLGVVAVTHGADGMRVEGDGAVVEWAVKMRRLPAESTLERRLDTIADGVLDSLARRLAAFHAGARSEPRISAVGRFATVARNARENFEQAQPQVGATLSQPVFDRLREHTEQWLTRLESLIEARAERGVPRDTHGDLRLDHVYWFPDQASPRDLVVIDCIEFNERFRFADPVADIAFLVMDLHFRGRRDLARTFAEAYFRASGDDEGKRLLRFYTAYRAAVRGKVEGMKLTETEIPAPERARAQVKARAHWILALGELEEPGRRPALILVGGLPGSGKSTLARSLGEHAGFEVIRSDQVRKELAGQAPDKPAPLGEDAYGPAFTERTYGECVRRAEDLLFQGRRVLVDASFHEDKYRRDFLAAAARWAVPALFLVCEAEPEVVRERLAQRRGDLSDADWPVYQTMAARWEEPSPTVRPLVRTLSTAATPEHTLDQALRVLGECP